MSAARRTTATPRSTPSRQKTPAAGRATSSNSDNRQPSSVREAIAQARARQSSAKKAASHQDQDEEVVGGRSLKVIIKQARSSGRLNITNRSLKEIPEEVWKMYDTDSSTVNLDFSSSSAENWYEAIDLTRLVAADNLIEHIDKRIMEFGALVFVDLHNNNLSSLPVEFGELKSLTTLNLSANKFTQLPSCIVKLSSLVDLQLASNGLSGTLDSSFGNLTKLEFLDISSNEISGLPEEFKNLKNLRKLFVRKNKLKALPGLALVGMTKLEELEASENRIETIFQEVVDGQPVQLESLKRLDLRNNRLVALDKSEDATMFKPTLSIPKLKELLISSNRLKSVGPLLHTTSELEILDISENLFEELPDGLIALKQLKRLDLRNNALKELAPELGMMTSLDVLSWEGNPLRSAPRGSNSTVALLQSLRDRLAAVDLESIQGPTIPDSTTSRRVGDHSLGTFNQQAAASKILDLSKKSLSNLSDDDLEALPFEPITIRLSFNEFSNIPRSLFTLSFSNVLTTLQLDHNKLTTFPLYPPDLPESEWTPLPNLTTLDLSANQITSIPDGSSPKPFPNLQTLNLNQNRISSLPPKLAWPKLTSLLVSMNLLSEITPSTFEGLEVLDLSNNNIGHLPPELGNVTTIKTLSVEGNTFRVPRYPIVQRGTAAIMEYLRGRIPK
ncbi:1499_t:CDS:2 [Paraglomus occultum]|uniref:1499_t:CDS:1 n=1 Tax=Paraglomus occultum TaxID=144539 RepID=A0A9N9BXZ2_9GLOM|nr:1499_t:CDS:2 [Paraglomus occultum]